MAGAIGYGSSGGVRASGAERRGEPARAVPAGTYERTCMVEDQVRVKVPAGDFDTYQIQCDMSYSYPSGSTLDGDRIWYSPKINHWVAINRHGRMFYLLSYEKK